MGEAHYFFSSQVLAVLVTGGIRHPHQDVVTLVEVAFSQTNADRKGDASIGLSALHGGPIGGSAALLMYDVIRGCWKSGGKSGKRSSSRGGKDG